MPSVGIDYWPATTHAPGVGRYVRELVRALVKLDDAPELKLFDVGPGLRAYGEKALGPKARATRAKLPRGALRVLASLGLSADRLVGGCDVFHGVFVDAPPVARARRTIAVAEFPRDGTPLRRYDGVLTFSAWAREQLIARCELAPNRVHALPVGCEHWRRELAEVPARDRPPTVLALGRLDHARAPNAILAACERLRARGLELQLAFVGRHGDAYDELRARVTRSPIVASVRFTSQARESDMPATVARASVLVHLSDLELSPVTPLEALASGCAVVASRLPAFEEALGPCARWIDAPVDELDLGVLAEALAQALDDARDATHAAQRRELARRFSWARHAALTLDLWRQILSR